MVKLNGPESGKQIEMVSAPFDVENSKEIVTFTIVSANYIGFAATLMQSVRLHHPECERFIILADAYREFDDIDLAATVVCCDELDIELIENMKLWYSIMEFNTAIKPFVFRKLFLTGYRIVLYLDPDIYLYSKLEEVFHALRRDSIVLTPHMMKPLQDGKEPSDLTIMKSGVYNFGFFAARNDPDSCGLIDWWCDRLFTHCRVDIAGNLFTDQRWMDLAPAFVQRPHILRHTGYNVAYWNLAHRHVRSDGDDQWLVDGLPLRFFHFSGIKPDDDKQFSKHQNRFTYDNLGEVAKLCAVYRAAVLANDWLKYSKVPYSYNRLADGAPIDDIMRRWILRALDDGRISSKELLKVSSAHFDQLEDETFGGGGRLTRFAHQLWLERADLRHAFDISHEAGFSGYLHWFCGTGASDDGIEAVHVQAARDLRNGNSSSSVTYPETEAIAPPWVAVASTAWKGRAKDAAAWLKDDVTFEVEGRPFFFPRQAALLWERRPDLQAHFKLDDRASLEGFTVWTITDGLLEGTIDAGLLSTRFNADFAALADISDYYGDVPITRGMILTRLIGRGREQTGEWRKFPAERVARLEHGLWFSHVAPNSFGWPTEYYSRVKTYFDAESEISVDGYFLSRTMIAIWEIRPDLQRAYYLHNDQSKRAYLRWLIYHAPTEFSIPVEQLCPRLVSHLGSPSGVGYGVTNLLQYIHDERVDLQKVFDLSTESGCKGLYEWSKGNLALHLSEFYLDKLAGEVNEPLAPVEAPTEAMIALTGHWDASSGLGEDIRCTAAALDVIGFTDYVIVNFDDKTVLSSLKQTIEVWAGLAVQVNIVHRNAETSMEDWLVLRRMGIQSAWAIGHWHWELSRIPSKWIHGFSFYDEIWASSQFAQAAFAEPGKRPVRLLPGTVIPTQMLRHVSRSELGLSENTTVFLFMFDASSYATRKNPQAVLAAFREAFPMGNEAVELVVKTQNASKDQALWAELTALGNDDRIHITDAKLSRDHLTGLMVSAQAFVSLHRSEGYGRGPLEAMLLGKPVIMTAYSGTNDFADSDCACLVRYTLRPVEAGEYPGVEGQSWADADISQAAGFMRWVHENPQQARQLGERAKQKIESTLSPTLVGRKTLSFVESILKPKTSITA